MLYLFNEDSKQPIKKATSRSPHKLRGTYLPTQTIHETHSSNRTLICPSFLNQNNCHRAKLIMRKNNSLKTKQKFTCRSSGCRCNYRCRGRSRQISCTICSRWTCRDRGWNWKIYPMNKAVVAVTNNKTVTIGTWNPRMSTHTCVLTVLCKILCL